MNFSEFYTYDESVESCLIHKMDRHNVVAGTPVRASKGHNGYRLVKLLGKTYRLHRVIWELHNGAIPDGMEIDHIDGDTNNNKLSNLRLVTKSQNAFNRKNHTGKTLPKGIVFLHKDSIYQARIMKEGKRFCFHHKDLVKCQDWLVTKRLELHGEYARN